MRGSTPVDPWRYFDFVEICDSNHEFVCDSYHGFRKLCSLSRSPVTYVLVEYHRTTIIASDAELLRKVMDIKVGAVLAAALVICGCATTALTPEGSIVRAVDADWANDCEFLGVMEVTQNSSRTPDENKMGALTELRNQIAAKGGNAYMVVTNGNRRSVDGYLIQAESYSCGSSQT